VSKRPRLSITQLQEQIFEREGFRVSFDRLGASSDELAAYDYPVMAPQSWKLSDWKRMRLGAYLLAFRRVTVYLGDDTPLKGDVTLGHLRDSYYLAQHGTLRADVPTGKIIDLNVRTARAPSRRRP